MMSANTRTMAAQPPLARFGTSLSTTRQRAAFVVMCVGYFLVLLDDRHVKQYEEVADAHHHERGSLPRGRETGSESGKRRLCSHGSSIGRHHFGEGRNVTDLRLA